MTDEPVPGSDIRKRYLVLYDGVPGGTGYLKELMRDQQNLLEVFEQAYDVLKNCTCQNDAEKDGCYRCLLAYRGRHDQQNTSRKAALELLKLILENRQHLKRTRDWMPSGLTVCWRANWRAGSSRPCAARQKVSPLVASLTMW